MAGKRLAPLKKRDVLYGEDTPKEKLIELARAHLAAGEEADALAFFCEAADEAGLREMQKRAIDAGDAFGLAQIARTLPKLVTRGDWDRLAQRAGELGKDAYAARARLDDPTAPLEPEEKRALEAEAESDEKTAPE